MVVWYFHLINYDIAFVEFVVHDIITMDTVVILAMVFQF